MRFDYLHQVREAIENYCATERIELDESLELEPVRYNECQRYTGPRSFGIKTRKGKGTMARLQVVIERFNNGRYELVCYAS